MCLLGSPVPRGYTRTKTKLKGLCKLQTHVHIHTHSYTHITILIKEERNGEQVDTCGFLSRDLVFTHSFIAFVPSVHAPTAPNRTSVCLLSPLGIRAICGSWLGSNEDVSEQTNKRPAVEPHPAVTGPTLRQALCCTMETAPKRVEPGQCH